MSTTSKVVLITGCSSGIGRALAVEFARRGHRVFASARRPQAMPAFEIPGVEILPLDVTDLPSIEAAVATVLERAGRVDVLVNNAGYGLMGPVLHDPPEEVRRQFETNVFGALAVAQAVIPSMVRRGSGLIVNVGSVSGVLATPYAGAYSASKAALHALTDAMRLELEPLGLTVVCLQPGAVRSRFGETATGITRTLLPDDSPYAPVRAFVEGRATMSQDQAMDTDAFARRVADALLRPDPPRVLRLGAHSFQMPFLRWLLPVRVLDAILRRKFGLARLRRPIRRPAAPRGPHR